MKTSLSILWHCECDLVIKLLTVIRNLIVTSRQVSGCCLGQTKISPFPFQSDHNYPNYGGDTGHFKVLFLFDCRCTGWKIDKKKCKGIKNLLATFLDWFEGLVVWYENFGNHRGDYTSDSAKSVANRYAIFLSSVDDSLIGQLTTKCVQCADQRCKIKLFKCPL